MGSDWAADSGMAARWWTGGSTSVAVGLDQLLVPVAGVAGATQPVDHDAGHRQAVAAPGPDAVDRAQDLGHPVGGPGARAR